MLLVILWASIVVQMHEVCAQSIRRPNIIIITTDQQMADAMSSRMGNKWLRTPNMDKLAAKGVFFTRAYAANPLCVPSRNSIITGQFPHATGVESNSDYANQRASKKHPWTGKENVSLGRYFEQAGYETAYFGKWHLNYDPKDKAAHGFETIQTFTKPVIDRSIPYAVDTFLRQSHKKPILLWASFINPHDICQWARFQALPEGPIAKVPPVSQWPPLVSNIAVPVNETEAMALIRKSYHLNRNLFPVGDYSQFDWRRLRWGYYRLIEKVDEHIGQLLAVLKKHGYDKNTLIVFTSDHGTCLGAHQFVQKTVFYEESVRVPLIFVYDGKISNGANNSLVNTGVDLLPTLLDFGGIEKPSNLPGRSLKKAVEQNITLDRAYVVSENKMVQGGPIDGSIPVVHGRMVRSRRYKYCLYDTLNHREALFDLEKDPGETVNIAEKASSSAILKAHRTYLKEFATRNKDARALEMLEDLHNSG